MASRMGRDEDEQEVGDGEGSQVARGRREGGGGDVRERVARSDGVVERRLVVVVRGVGSCSLFPTRSPLVAWANLLRTQPDRYAIFA